MVAVLTIHENGRVKGGGDVEEKTCDMFIRLRGGSMVVWKY